MYKINDIVKFRLDDSKEPGYAKVKLIKPTIKILSYQCWKVKVIEILKPSKLKKVKEGSVIASVSERWFSK